MRPTARASRENPRSIPPPPWILPPEPFEDERLLADPFAPDPLAEERFFASRGACVELGCGLVPPPDEDFRAGPFAPEEPFFAAPAPEALVRDAPDVEELLFEVADFDEREPEDVDPLPLFDVAPDLPAPPPRVEFRPPLVARLAMSYTVSVRHLSRHTSHSGARALPHRREARAAGAERGSPAPAAPPRSTPDGSARGGRCRASALWRLSTRVDRAAVALTGRLRVSGDVPDELRGRPLLLAANHIGNLDPFVLVAACARRDLDPRFLATAGLFSPPLVGAVLRRGGHIRVDRTTPAPRDVLATVTAALRSGQRPVLLYPEGRIGLEPDLWPERGKCGVGRMALAADAVVIPISQWGAHEAVHYGGKAVLDRRGLAQLLASWLRAIPRRPELRVHFGHPVDLTGLSADRPGDSARARDRIMRAITRDLVPLRADEPDEPRFRDPTRPATGRRSPWRP